MQERRLDFHQNGCIFNLVVNSQLVSLIPESLSEEDARLALLAAALGRVTVLAMEFLRMAGRLEPV